jgi:hypothetical protein
MWPFDALRELRERARTRRAFSLYLSPEMVERIANDPTFGERMKPKRRDVSFILFQVRDDPPERAEEYLERARAIVWESKGMVDVTLSSVVVACFGAVPEDDPPPDLRKDAAASLMTALGTDIRLIQGKRECLFGLNGTEHRSSYGALIPNLSHHLETLLRLEFGQSLELAA